MEIVFRRADPARRPAGALAVLVPQATTLPAGPARAIDRAAHGALATLLRRGDFRGAANEAVVLYPAGLRAPRLIAVGMGPASSLDAHHVRQAAAIAARRARELNARTLAIALPAAGGDPAALAQAAAEGAVLGHYRHTAYRGANAPALQRVEILGPAGGDALGDAVARGVRWAEATCLARDLARTPGQDLTPERLAERAQEIARSTGATAHVLEVDAMERLGMGAILAVGRGSVHPPRFIVLEHEATVARARPAARGRKAAAAPTVVVIGKGVTFDTGGISLKPRENMEKMKYDMSGAAAVLGLFQALPTLPLPFRVVGLIPSAENMPGGRALKPGDVVRALDGTTIEVVNTDAEGRLLLADALGYARRYAPDVVVDLATLTGAISIALGHLAAGLFTDDDALAGELLAAAGASGERLWRMPLWPEYALALPSDTADIANSGAREGGACNAAAFLQRFAPGPRWAHLDIASTAWSPADRPHESRGPTGFGVRLLLEWLSGRAAASAAG